MDANTTGQIISTQLPWPISADWIIALAAIATLAVGMIIAWKQISIQEEQAEIARTQTQIARQQLAILDYQEQERRKEKGKAELKPQLIEHATTNVTDRYLLRIKNEGKARARDIKITIDDMPAHEYLKSHKSLMKEEDVPLTLDHGVPWECSIPFAAVSLVGKIVANPLVFIMKPVQLWKGSRGRSTLILEHRD